MIISHRHKFIFFAVPKTGTHSVRRALRAHLGEEDLEQVGLFVKKKFPFPELRDVDHGHINARQIRAVLGEDTFRSYFKFAFVRNPFDRYVSFCAFMGRHGPFQANPRLFMKQVARDPQTRIRLLALPQHEFLTDDAGALAMDALGRTEEMQSSYDRLCARLALPSATLERANETQHRPYQDYYDQELHHWVARVYQRDFEMFGYPFDAHAAQPA